MIKYRIKGFCLFLFVLGLFLISRGTVWAMPRFLTYPHAGTSSYKLQQAWTSSFDPDHNSMDYIKGTLDQGGTWVAFDVLASDAGDAYYSQGALGWGNYVKIKHVVSGTTYYTLYAHLYSSTLPVNTWVSVTRGQKIGTSGESGAPGSGTHLHYEFSQGSYGSGYRLDPYDIYNTRQYYPEFGGSMGSDYAWTTNPPSAPGTNDTLSDIATFYDYGDCYTKIHAFLSTGSSFDYQGPGGWWESSPGGYCLSSVKATASGDFDGDGDSDIAVFYDYGSNETRIHVLKADPLNREFDYQGNSGWWSGTSFPASQIKYALAGNFNSDNKSDIAVFYDDGDGTTTIYTFISSGSGFTRYTWWSPSSGYSLSSIVGAASGDFDYDGYDDLATVYDYTNGATRIHVWLSTGSSFAYQTSQGWWRVDSGYTASNVKHVLAEKYNSGGLEDLALFYDYGSGAARIHVFLSTGSSFSYQGSSGWWSTSSGYDLNLVPFALTGQYNTAGTVRDITTIYDYPGSETRFHEFLGTGSAFSYEGSSGWWSATGYTTTNIKQAVTGYFGAP